MNITSWPMNTSPTMAKLLQREPTLLFFYESTAVIPFPNLLARRQAAVLLRHATRQAMAHEDGTTHEYLSAKLDYYVWRITPLGIPKR
jgi:hypothetical protein